MASERRAAPGAWVQGGRWQWAGSLAEPQARGAGGLTSMGGCRVAGGAGPASAGVLAPSGGGVTAESGTQWSDGLPLCASQVA